MTPVVPVPHRGAHLVTFSANGDTTIQSFRAAVDGDGCVMTEWAPSAEELVAVQAGATVRVWLLHTGIGLEDGATLPPIAVDINPHPRPKKGP
jgi:hypothetical protein